MTDPSCKRLIFHGLITLGINLVASGNLVHAQGVSFSSDLAAVLSERCMGCHGGNRPRRALRIESYSTLMRGSENGSVIEAGDPENSLLILKMKGEADGDRMPPNGAPLSNDVIEKFSAWIQAGARFDGKDPTFALDRLVSARRRQTMTRDELVADAIEQAKKKWLLAFPNTELKTRLTDGLLLVGRKVNAETNPELNDVADLLAAALNSAKKTLGVSDVPLKGPLTIFHIPRSYDFAEFTQMVERREAGDGAKDYWRPDGGMGYVVLGPKSTGNNASSNSRSSKRKPTRVSPAQASRFATALVLNRLGAPEWYADGVSFLAFEKANRKSATISAWKRRAPTVLYEAKSAKQIFDAELPGRDADVARWSFARYLATDKKRMSGLHQAISKGNAFDRSFTAMFGKPADKTCDDWLKRLKRGRRK